MAEEDTEDESELRLDRSEFKKFVKIARTKPLTFAFCPTGGTEEPMFAVHRRRKPDALGKAARKEAEETKYACGKMRVEGKELVLTCDRMVAGMDKKVAKMLRKLKLPLSVRIETAGGEAA